MILFTLVFLHIKIPRITTQAKVVIVAMSPTMGRGANPTYATLTPATTVATPANIPTPPIHLLRRTLFAIATPKIIATAPCIIRLILLMPISIHLIPSATRKAMASSSVVAEEEEEAVVVLVVLYQESTALFRAIPSTAWRMAKVLAAIIVTAKPSHAN